MLGAQPTLKSGTPYGAVCILDHHLLELRHQDNPPSLEVTNGCIVCKILLIPNNTIHLFI